MALGAWVVVWSRPVAECHQRDMPEQSTENPPGAVGRVCSAVLPKHEAAQCMGCLGLVVQQPVPSSAPVGSTIGSHCASAGTLARQAAF